MPVTEFQQSFKPQGERYWHLLKEEKQAVTILAM